MPEVPESDTVPAPGSPYERIGGDAAVRTLVDRFYDLMDLEPRYAQLRAVHGSDLTAARDKLYWYLSGWLGGPQLYVQRFGHPRLRARHLPFPIASIERDQWLACMSEAMRGTGVDAALQAELEQTLRGLADWMRNRPD